MLLSFESALLSPRLYICRTEQNADVPPDLPIIADFSLFLDGNKWSARRFAVHAQYFTISRVLTRQGKPRGKCFGSFLVSEDLARYLDKQQEYDDTIIREKAFP